MNPSPDRDAPQERTITVRSARPGAPVTIARPDRDAKLSQSPEAQRARRYRARKRGENVPVRKPGPAPQSRDYWCDRAQSAEARLREARQRLSMYETLPAYKTSRARIVGAQLAGAAEQLRQALAAADPVTDLPAVRDALGSLAAELEERRSRWQARASFAFGEAGPAH